MGGYNDVDTLVNSSGGAFPAFVLANGWPTQDFTNSINTSPGFDINGYAERLDPHDALPYYVENRAFQVQRDLGWNTLLSVGYIGNTGVHLPSRIDPVNEMPPQYLTFGSLLTQGIDTPAVQLAAPIAAMPIDTNTGMHAPFMGFVADMGCKRHHGTGTKVVPSVHCDETPL